MGRPRTFCKEEALDRALDVFWRKGYEGASLSDLTQAMEISPPSLYAAFGNKEELFRLVLDRYLEQRRTLWQDAFSKPSAREAMQHLLKGTAEFLSDKQNPRGCLIVQGALTCSESADPAREELNRRRAEGQALIRERFERARTGGELPEGIMPTDLARYVSAVMQGMSVQAASGASRKELLAIAQTAMRIWPD